jgi:hypothetical protein
LERRQDEDMDRPRSFHEQLGEDASESVKALGSFKIKALLREHNKHQRGEQPNYKLIHTKKTNKNVTKPYRPTITRKRKYSRVIHFTHIHKSAGTLFCRMAFKNKVNTNHGENCNVQKDQYCCGGQDTLEAQIMYANWTYWDLVATEREMYDNMAPDYYDYVVMLRNSKERYYSHWGHLRRMISIGPGVQKRGLGNSAWVFGNNTVASQQYLKERKIPAGVDPLGNFQQWIRGQPDNWNTRILCGAKCRTQPKYKITRELFNYTLQRADKFAHFLFVEDLEASYNQLAQAYQWGNYSQVTTKHILENQSHRRQDKEEAQSKIAQEEWDPLESPLDDALYEFAKRKFHHVKDPWQEPFQNQADVDRYFSEGFQRGCQDACCGNCTSY